MEPLRPDSSTADEGAVTDCHGRRLFLRFAAAAAVLAALRTPAGDAAAARQRIVDDLGRDIDLALPVRRAVVFNQWNLELVRAIGAIGWVVGADAQITRDRAYWANAGKVAVVGQSQTSPNYEAIVALQPDVVIIPRNGLVAEASRALAPFAIPVVVITGWDALKHERNVTLLGRLFGTTQRAAQVNSFHRRYRQLLATRLAGVARRRVYLEQVSADYRTPVQGSGWNDMIALAGGINIFGDVNLTGQPAARGNIQEFDVDPEQILARRPDLIVKLEPDQYQPVSRESSVRVLEEIAGRPGFAQLPAVRTGQVYDLSNFFANACSKILGALQIAKWLYPQRFVDTHPSDAMRQWLEDFQGVRYLGNDWVSLAQIRQSR
jgi:iron complex transport system substrate-binding protein